MMIETVLFSFVFLEILYHPNFRKDKDIKENSEGGGLILLTVWHILAGLNIGPNGWRVIQIP